VGVCHGVIAERCPQARVIDITHGIARHDVRAGAMALRSALPFMPAGVHMAVVDPGVGSESRRAVALRTAAGRLLVGPDNGLLAPAAERLGGVVEAVSVGLSKHRLEPVSATFHGRDLFAPVAAALAAGEPLGEAGEPLAVGGLVPLEVPRSELQGGALVAHALTIDRFGNVTLNVDHDQLAEFGLKLSSPVTLEVGGVPFEARYARTFAEVGAGALLVYEDSQRQLAIAVNRGSAAARLGLRRDSELRVIAA
jgi:S-adenosylmethionine hydrolase